jgi:hypothetical protein
MIICPHCHKRIDGEEDKEADHQLVLEMRDYLLSAKRKQLGKMMCERCKIEDAKSWHLHHKRYGKDITLYDLELLCDVCHWNIPACVYN